MIRGCPVDDPSPADRPCFFIESVATTRELSPCVYDRSKSPGQGDVDLHLHQFMPVGQPTHLGHAHGRLAVGSSSLNVTAKIHSSLIASAIRRRAIL